MSQRNQPAFLQPTELVMPKNIQFFGESKAVDHDFGFSILNQRMLPHVRQISVTISFAESLGCVSEGASAVSQVPPHSLHAKDTPQVRK